MKNAVFKEALAASTPVILGYMPTGMAFGLMLTSAGYNWLLAPFMSMVIYAGAGQYLAIQFFLSHTLLLQAAVMTFLINSKHLFYGFSLLADYKRAGFKRVYLIFGLTDEAYAVLTKPHSMEPAYRTWYCFFVTLICHLAWITFSFVGAAAGSLLAFDTTGMSFAMTALFIVIVLEQLKTYRTRLPFIIGVGTSLFALFAFGSANMLLVSSILSGALLLLFRKQVESRV